MERHIGIPLKFRLPSGRDITIREQNGNDDELLSTIDPQSPDKREDNIKGVNAFIASLVIEDGQGQAFMTEAEVLDLKLNDKYYILLKTRRHSLGDEVKFSWECTNERCAKLTPYKDNLARFDRDLSQEVTPEDAEKKFDKDVIFPYPKGQGSYLEHVLSSGKKIRLKIMTGHSELFLLEAGKSKVSKNTELYARELSIFDPALQRWSDPLAELSVFSARDMQEIRSVVQQDKQFNMVTECKCPHCGNTDFIPMNAIRNFFFPTEI